MRLANVLCLSFLCCGAPAQNLREPTPDVDHGPALLRKRSVPAYHMLNHTEASNDDDPSEWLKNNATAHAASIVGTRFPLVAKRIGAALALAQENASFAGFPLTSLVNNFIGTANLGDVNPGSSVPFGVAKISADCEGYAPAGYVENATARITGFSPLHDSGIGSFGSYSIMKAMPLLCPGGFDTCATKVDHRLRLRKPAADDASPGYFSLTLDNGIKFESTSTRRAGIERYTYPAGVKPYLSLDLAHDTQRTFQGGNLSINPDTGRVTIGGRWFPGFGPATEPYPAYACYDLLSNGNQTLEEYGLWIGDQYGVDTKALGETRFNISRTLLQSGLMEAGALVSFAPTAVVTVRVGVSFASEDQACANAEAEVGGATFAEVQAGAVAEWEDRLGRVEVDLPGTDDAVLVLLYSSLYRAFLTPNNATGEGTGQFAGTSAPYFDSIYCNWDTSRTFYPFMALHSPEIEAQIMESFLDTWRVRGYLPECQSNQLPAWTQGGSDGTNILADFAVKYHDVPGLNIDLEEVYRALYSDAMVTPPQWDLEGRQIYPYLRYGYVPFGVLDPESSGMQTREASRTIEYAWNDFAVRQVAKLLNRTEDVEYFSNRSLWYRNVWNPETTSQGFSGFAQKRWPNGTFFNEDPAWCSPIDSNKSRICNYDPQASTGFYESSSWEYSLFAPHDQAGVVELCGGAGAYADRLDAFFSLGIYLAANEPGFSTVVGYHYADRPTKSVDAVRSAVYSGFNASEAGLPGNDDQAAMATYLLFHILGLYPVPSTTQYLITSPLLPRYTIHNRYMNASTSVVVHGFDPASLRADSSSRYAATSGSGWSVYVANASFDGATLPTKCWVDYASTFKKGGRLELWVTGDRAAAEGCGGGGVPDSLSTGGW